MNNAVASLQQKDGPETGPTSRGPFSSNTSPIRELYWAYDGQGRFLSFAQLAPHVCRPRSWRLRAQGGTTQEGLWPVAVARSVR